MITFDVFQAMVLPVLEGNYIKADAPTFNRGIDIIKAWELLPQNQAKCTENHTSLLAAMTILMTYVKNDKIPPCQYKDMLQALGISVPSE